MIVLSRLLCRSPAASCTSVSGLVTTATGSETLLRTGVCDMTGVDGVAGNAADDEDSLALAAGKTHSTHH